MFIETLFKIQDSSFELKIVTEMNIFANQKCKNV